MNSLGKKEMNYESNQLSKSNYQFMEIQRFEKAEEYVNHSTEIFLGMKNSTGQTVLFKGKKKKKRIRKEKEKYRIPQQIIRELYMLLKQP